MRYKVLIDPGHVDGYNIGAFPGYAEGTQMFYLAGYLKNELSKYNIDSVISRKTVNQDIPLYDRGQLASQYRCQIFISLHSDAVPSEKANGTTIFYSVKRPKSKALAEDIVNGVHELIKKDIPYTTNRSAQTRRHPDGYSDYYGVIRSAVRSNFVEAAFLIEHAFHTNYKECSWLYQEENLKNIAKVEASAIAKYFGITDKPKIDESTEVITDKPITSDYTLYTVKPGDSWWRIAARQMNNGTKYKYLAEFNGFTCNHPLSVGDKIKIPAVEMNYTLYTVKQGDSWWRIAARQMNNGTKYKYLAEFNSMSADDPLHTNDIIKIPR